MENNQLKTEGGPVVIPHGAFFHSTGGGGEPFPPVMNAILGGLIVAVAAGVDLAQGSSGSVILSWYKALKDKWRDYKYRKNVQPIVDRLKDDKDIQQFLLQPASKQRGKWQKLLSSKLTDKEKQYIDQIGRKAFK